MGAIYRIRNVVDGKVYIGQAVKFEKRKARHLWELRTGRHSNEHLQRAWLLHGEENFVFEVLADNLAREVLVAEEQRHIDAFRSADCLFGYNKSPAAGSNVGVKYSEASRLRMSAAQKGRTFTDDARRRIAQTLTGRPRSQQAIEKHRIAMKDVPHTAEWNARISAAHNQRSGALPLTAFGKTQHINDWAREYGLNAGTLRNRLKRSGMTLEQALTAPKHKGRRKDILGPVSQPEQLASAALSEMLEAA
jgi:group I intron endonuclease